MNAINPGFVRSDRWATRVAARMARDGVGEPEDAANLVAYITGAEGRFLHGALIDLDGGQTKTV